MFEFSFSKQWHSQFSTTNLIGEEIFEMFIFELNIWYNNYWRSINWIEIEQKIKACIHCIVLYSLHGIECFLLYSLYPQMAVCSYLRRTVLFHSHIWVDSITAASLRFTTLQSSARNTFVWQIVEFWRFVYHLQVSKLFYENEFAGHFCELYICADGT